MSDNPLSRLMAGLKREPHDYQASLQTFPELSVEAIVRDLTLNLQGTERGTKEEPESKSSALDTVETAIVERVNAAKNNAYGTLLDQKNLYEQRLVALDFESRFSAIRQAAPYAISTMRASVAIGRDELNALRRDLIFKEKERSHFRDQHGLMRAARISSAGSTMLKIGILLILAVVELAINGSFLAKGSEAGLVGGVIEATSFACLNLGASFLLAYFGIRQLNRRGLFAKLAGLLALILLIAVMVGLNLMLAHYREISGSFLDEAGQKAMHRMLTHPLALTDVKSWLLFAIGFLFASIAALDGIYFDDPFPGYAGVEYRVREAHDRYTGQRQARIAELDEIKEEAREALEEANRDLAVRRSEYDSILENRARVYSLFGAHQDQLERALNTLLSTYRDANRQARKTAVPKRFGTTMKLERIKEPLPETGAGREDLRRSIAEAQALLISEIKEITAEFEAGVQKYHQIDDLVAD